MTDATSPTSRRSELRVRTLAGHEIASGRSIDRTSANFWREFMYWWTAHCPIVVLLTRPFFLWFAIRFSSALRDGPTANARRILGQGASEASVRKLRNRIISSAYTCIYELGRAARSTKDQLRKWVERVDGSENYFEARKSKNGAILLTAHIGPFEVGASALMDHEPKVHVVFRRDERASFDRLRSKLRRNIGLMETAIDDGWSIWGRVRDVLMADEVVLIQGDRVMPGQRGIAVRFFDGHILLPTGPVKLAMVTGSPIIPIFSIRTRIGRCRLVINEPIYVTREDGALGADHPAMLQIAAAIERQVRDHPEQWAMYERAWCEDQEDAALPEQETTFPTR